MMRSRGAVALLSLLVILAGCSGESGETTSVPSSSTTVSTSTTPTSTSASSTSTASVPASITGYGDFSDQQYFAVDWFLVTQLTAQCLQDHGFPVTVIPPGDGISFQSVPGSQNQLAQQYSEACRSGLNVPEFEWPTPEQIELIYFYWVALRDCLIAEGYSVSEPPSLDQFIDSYTIGPWSPYENVPGGSGWDSIQMKCPQSPLGGWSSWEPGDPIIPITPTGDGGGP